MASGIDKEKAQAINRELLQLSLLNREIELDRQRLMELEIAATSASAKITGLPHASGHSDKVAIAAQIVDLKKMIDDKILRTVKEYARLENYITQVDDSLIRQIMTLRHICGLSWVQVAKRLGGNSDMSIQMQYWRFLKKQAHQGQLCKLLQKL